jgi:hypothetical protein
MERKLNERFEAIEKSIKDIKCENRILHGERLDIEVEWAREWARRKREESCFRICHFSVSEPIYRGDVVILKTGGTIIPCRKDRITDRWWAIFMGVKYYEKNEDGEYGELLDHTYWPGGPMPQPDSFYPIASVYSSMYSREE